MVDACSFGGRPVCCIGKVVGVMRVLSVRKRRIKESAGTRQHDTKTDRNQAGCDTFFFSSDCGVWYAMRKKVEKRNEMKVWRKKAKKSIPPKPRVMRNGEDQWGVTSGRERNEKDSSK